MRTREELYSEIAPSLKRKNCPFIESDANECIRKISDFLLMILLKRHFFAVRIKNSHYFNTRDKSLPNIIYAPHNCWWDGLMGYFLCRRIFKTEMRVMVEDLQALPLLAKLGAFSIDKKTKSSLLKSLNYASRELRSPDKTLYLFPQGIIRPPDYSPIEFQSGMSYIAQKLQGTNFIALTYRYCFLRARAPEVLIEVHKPITVKQINNRQDFIREIECHFKNAIESQKKDIAQGNLSNYVTVLRQEEGLLQKIEKLLKK